MKIQHHKRVLWSAVGLACAVAAVLLARGLRLPPVRAEALSPADRARQKDLMANLHSLREHIDLYKAEHGGRCPGFDNGGRFSGELFNKQLMDQTDVRGTTWQSALRANSGRSQREFKFGPYYCKAPTNPFVSPWPDTGYLPTVTAGEGPPSRDGSSDWYVDGSTGRIFANHAKRKTVRP